MKAIHAVYEDGVFKPTEPVDLPEHSEVKVEPIYPDQETAAKAEAKKRIHKILSERYDSGDPFGAERHNEHQP